MCWCTPEIRVPFCGKPNCVPPTAKMRCPVCQEECASLYETLGGTWLHSDAAGNISNCKLRADTLGMSRALAGEPVAAREGDEDTEQSHGENKMKDITERLYHEAEAYESERDAAMYASKLFREAAEAIRDLRDGNQYLSSCVTSHRETIAAQKRDIGDLRATVEHLDHRLSMAEVPGLALADLHKREAEEYRQTLEAIVDHSFCEITKHLARTVLSKYGKKEPSHG